MQYLDRLGHVHGQGQRNWVWNSGFEFRLCYLLAGVVDLFSGSSDPESLPLIQGSTALSSSSYCGEIVAY